MATTLKIHANTSNTDSPLNTSGVEWTELDLVNDFLIFTAGSNVVKDGESVPSQDDLNQAGIILTGSEIIVDNYLIADFDVDELKEVFLMGDQNSRYVLAFDFDGETASEGILEIFDNTDLNTIDNISLGAGTASGSYFRGITTTDGTSGSPGWVGTVLAGSGAGNFLFLNNQNGVLSAAGTLYCNLKVIIPSTATQSGAETPVIVVKYTTN